MTTSDSDFPAPEGVHSHNADDAESRKPGKDADHSSGDEDMSSHPAGHPAGGPRVPAPIGPAEGATIDEPSVTFEWEHVPDAETYQLQIAKDRSFDEIAFDGRVGSSSRFTYSGLPPQEGLTLYWRVRAYRSDEEWTPYGTIGTFVLADWRPEQPDVADASGSEPVADVSSGGSYSTEPLAVVFSIIVTVVAVGVGMIYMQTGTETDDAMASDAVADTTDLYPDEPVPNEDGNTYRISIDRAMDIVVQRSGPGGAGDTTSVGAGSSTP
ncbi:hypothetical protein [Longibacter sp.]|uniref:hypothetical protein n=1 Tax=Longibacter sp. TaxID=2045415 RepID=UPI003EBC6DAC